MKKTISHSGYSRVPIILLLIVIAVLFKNCEAPTEEPNLVNPAREWFEKNKGTDWDALPKIDRVKSIDWNNAVTNGKSIEVPIELKGDLVGGIYDGKESIMGKISVRLVLWPQSEGYEAGVFEFIHVGGNVPRQLGDLEQSGFTGMIRASYGGTQKHAALFDHGKQSGPNDDVSIGRIKELWCLYFYVRHELTVDDVTYIWTEWDDHPQYCYDPTAPQVPLPPEGGGWVLDYTGEGPGGSGSGDETNWNPGYPENPQDGDVYEIVEPSGKRIKYVYNSSTGNWQWGSITLPAVLITMYDYPQLFNAPTSLVVIADDGLQYFFDEGSSSWIGTTPSVISKDPTGARITDIVDYLECLSRTQGGEVTIYSTQPTNGSRATWSGPPYDPNVGHTFVGIRQGDITRVLGYYPQSGVNPTNPSKPGVLFDDSGHAYDASVTIYVDAAHLSAVLDLITNAPANYDLNTYNCTDFGLAVSQAAGYTLPDTQGTWPGGGGTNPGDLGEDIRGLNSGGNIVVNRTAGTAPNLNGDCD